MQLKLSNLKQLQKKLNIDLIGVAKVERLKENEKIFQDWLDNNYHADMNWMKNNFDKRADSQLLFPNTKSVIVIGINYYNKTQQNNSENLLVSKYVTKVDYHKFLKQKLFLLLKEMKNIDNSIKGKVCVDTSPIFEKAWGIKAGLGWRGKNSLLISPEYGSWIFLGILLLNVEFDKYSEEIKNRCGNCNLCVEQCPNGAILENKKINANRCISYLTIEDNDEMLPRNVKLNNWIYGCDICQDVCPFNKQNEQQTIHPEFKIKEEFQNKSKSYWNNLSIEEYKIIKKQTTIERTKYSQFLRNINHNLLHK